MAKKGPRGTIRLVSADGKSVYYSQKNSRNTTDKMKRRKYNKVTRKHEVHTEGKMPSPK